jgi:hypothetical protein
VGIGLVQQGKNIGNWFGSTGKEYVGKIIAFYKNCCYTVYELIILSSK